MKSILIVDDEQVMRDFLADVLEDDFDIAKAADGDEAIELLKNKEFDLIITDMKMPKVSGEEVVKFAKETYPQARVIVISGYSSLSSVSKTVGYGVNAFLAKPFTIKQIRSEIEKSFADSSDSENMGMENVI